MHIPEDIDQAKFARDRQQILDAARTAKWAGGDADNTDSFVDVFLQTTVQDVLQQTRVSVVVFRGDDGQSIGMIHFGRESAVLDCLTRIVDGQRERGNIYEFRDRKSTRLNSSHPSIS